MINVGLISDTHGRFKEEWKEHFKRCDLLIHAGDLDDSEAYEWFSGLKIPTYIVRGNCDRGMYADYLQDKMIVPAGGKLFLVIHNRAYIPWVFDDVDFVIFGHTHIPADEMRGGIRFINPGSAGNDRGAGKSMAILHLEGEEATLERISL